MTDDDCRRIYSEAMELPNRNAVSVMRYIIAAYQAKLLAGVELPEPAGCVWCDYCDLDGAVIRPKGYYTRTQESPLYTADQLQQYAAAAAVKAVSDVGITSTHTAFQVGVRVAEKHHGIGVQK